MAVLDNNRRQALVTNLKKIASKKLNTTQLKQFNQFIVSAMHSYPDEDYLSRPVDDLFCSIWALFSFASAGDVNSYTKVKVFNLKREPNNCGNHYTTIFINQPDLPFLVDSLRIIFNRRGLNIYTLQSRPIWVVRDPSGAIKSTQKDFLEGAEREVFISAEVDRHVEDELAELESEIIEAMQDVKLAVDDFELMRLRIKNLIDELKVNIEGTDEVDETIEFLSWMYQGYFTFIGCVDFQQAKDEVGQTLAEVVGSRCGLLKKYTGKSDIQAVDALNPQMGALCKNSDILRITKSPQRFGIHRDVYADYLVIKRFNSGGEPVGEVRFLGLYTSQFYSYSSRRIPILRKKVHWVMKNSGFDPQSHDGKALLAILDFHPRDELFRVSRESLTDTAIGIWQIYERRSIRVFMHPDPFARFVSCIVFIPREAFNKDIRDRIQSTIGERIGASESEVSTQFLTESVLVRIYLVYHICGFKDQMVNTLELEAIVKEITRNWSEDFTQAAVSAFDESAGLILAKRYQYAFPAAYRDLYQPAQALQHIKLFDVLENENQLAVDFQQQQTPENDYLRLKLFHRQQPLELSTMVPMIENLGFKVVMEHPYLIQAKGEIAVWMQEFYLLCSLEVNVDIAAVQNNFVDALSNIWCGTAENDSFNRLIVGAGLDWRSIAILRLYARYLKQLGISFSQEFFADTLSRYPDITGNLIALFRNYFDPRNTADYRRNRCAEVIDNVQQSLESVNNINEDSLIRGYLEVIQATLRTNFFQNSDNGDPKPYMSVKLDTRKISLAPKPRPNYEIFVYSQRVEGVHLRGDKVARGGLRWSDRIEDYRTEILGLLKAQQVKNAVIVPSGAKGGFVAKQASMATDSASVLAEGIACYRLYIQALMDITDNLINGQIVAPDNVVRRDSDDPYLVVAADKGTARFSDIANEISSDNKFWLGDAFASGGCNGYDHKGMGITARGAWVAVQRHFREIGIDIQRQAFTVIGIGDMAGDVFGNGMLLSQHIQLVAAFNHLHIFVDPNPNSTATYNERKRLFEMPKSTWNDFDKTVLSTGGMIYSRSAKYLQLTPQIKVKFDIEHDRIAPAEFIKLLLKSTVDLIWNGGIGTYVKSSVETDIEVGDRANDALRVNGNQLRCKVFGEGGNLGMTQRGRIEYSIQGGLCNTDFIDNAAGVDCSDHEVNIKVILNDQLSCGNLTLTQRNKFLASMTDSVANLVLHNSIRGTQGVSLALHANQLYPEYQRFMRWLERGDKLDRNLEFLPSDKQLKERQKRGQAIWTRPELSVLICYSKVRLKQLLLDADIESDPWLIQSIQQMFPAELVESYGDVLNRHQLRQQIAATHLANDLVDRAGLSFTLYQMESTGAAVSEIIRAYSITTNVLEVDYLWRQIEGMTALSASLQLDLLQILTAMIRRACRWFLRHRKQHLDCQQVIGEFLAPMQATIDCALQSSQTELAQMWAANRDRLLALGVESQLAERMALSDTVNLNLSIVDSSLRHQQPIKSIAKLYFAVGDCLSLDWLIVQIIQLQTGNRWQNQAREAYVDDIESQRQDLVSSLAIVGAHDDIETKVVIWQQRQELAIQRWQLLIGDLRQVATLEFSMIAVALKELRQLVRCSAENTEF